MSILKKLRDQQEPLNVSELAKLLAVTEATIQKWARQKQIPCIRIGDTIRFDTTMLCDWFEQQAICTLQNAGFSHARAPDSPDDHEMRWTDLGELAPEGFNRIPDKSKDGNQ